MNEEFSNYEAYDFHYGNNKLIWKNTFIGTTSEANIIINNDYLKPCTNVARLDMTKGIWFRNKTTSDYNRYLVPHPTPKYCLFPLMTKESIRKCIGHRFNNTIIMMGDSHIRYSYYIFLKLILNRDHFKIVHSDVKVETYNFKWSPMCTNLAGSLKKFIKAKSTQNQLLILDTGAWDLYRPSVKVSTKLHMFTITRYQSI